MDGGRQNEHNTKKITFQSLIELIIEQSFIEKPSKPSASTSSQHKNYKAAVGKRHYNNICDRRTSNNPTNQKDKNLVEHAGALWKGDPSVITEQYIENMSNVKTAGQSSRSLQSDVHLYDEFFGSTTNLLPESAKYNLRSRKRQEILAESNPDERRRFEKSVLTKSIKLLRGAKLTSASQHQSISLRNEETRRVGEFSGSVYRANDQNSNKRFKISDVPIRSTVAIGDESVANTSETVQRDRLSKHSISLRSREKQKVLNELNPEERRKFVKFALNKKPMELSKKGKTASSSRHRRKSSKMEDTVRAGAAEENDCVIVAASGSSVATEDNDCVIVETNGSGVATNGSGVATEENDCVIVEASGSGVAASGSGVAASGSGVAASGSGVAASGSGVAASGSGVAASGSGVAASGSAVAASGSGVAASGSGVAASGSGVAASGSGVAASGSGVAASGSGVAASGSGVAASGSGVAASGSGVAASGSGVAASGSGVAASGSGVAASGSGVAASGSGVAASGSGVAASGSGVAASGSPEQLTPNDNRRYDVLNIERRIDACGSILKEIMHRQDFIRFCFSFNSFNRREWCTFINGFRGVNTRLLFLKHDLYRCIENLQMLEYAFSDVSDNMLSVVNKLYYSLMDSFAKYLTYETQYNFLPVDNEGKNVVEFKILEQKNLLLDIFSIIRNVKNFVGIP